MAGLALIFSLAEAKDSIPPPMILLDEVDAHLDETNINLLMAFLKHWKATTKGKHT